MFKDHQDGYEKERKFHLILYQAGCENPYIKARTIKRIIAHFAPEFIEDLFKTKSCIRRLKYIGCGCEEPNCFHGPEYFKLGKIYESIDFNGASYSIKGYKNGKRRIGCSFFEWVD